MSEKASSEQIQQLAPVLGSLARMIAAGSAIDDDPLEMILLGMDIEPTAAIRTELVRWARLLQGVRDEASLRIACVEALMQRGLPEATVLLAVDAVVGSAPPAAEAPVLPKPAAPGLRASVTSLDLGTLRAGQGGSIEFEVQGGPGQVIVLSDQVRVTPLQFGSQNTRLRVEVRCVVGGLLWTALRLVTAAETIEVPLVAQWSAHPATAGPDAVIGPNAGAIPPPPTAPAPVPAPPGGPTPAPAGPTAVSTGVSPAPAAYAGPYPGIGHQAVSEVVTPPTRALRPSLPLPIWIIALVAAVVLVGILANAWGSVGTLSISGGAKKTLTTVAENQATLSVQTVAAAKAALTQGATATSTQAAQPTSAATTSTEGHVTATVETHPTRTAAPTVVSSVPSVTQTRAPTRTAAPTAAPAATATSVDEAFFADTFEALDPEKWSVDSGPGGAFATNGFVAFSSNASRYPYIYTNQNPFPLQGDFRISFRARYRKVGDCGVGIIFTTYVPPVGLSQDEVAQRQQEAETNGIQMGVWQDAHAGLVYWFRSGSERVDVPLSGPTTNWNEFVIECSSGSYTAYINGHPIHTSKSTNRRPSAIWIGHPATLPSDCAWSSLDIDYVLIES